MLAEIFVFLAALLRENSHATRFTHLKCTIWWLLVNLE